MSKKDTRTGVQNFWVAEESTKPALIETTASATAVGDAVGSLVGVLMDFPNNQRLKVVNAALGYFK